MAKFHIGRGGKAAACSARKGKCPFGSDDEHFSTRDAARVAAEERMAKTNGVLNSSKKTTTPAAKKSTPKKPAKTTKSKKKRGIAEDGYRNYDLGIKYNPNVSAESQIQNIHNAIEKKYGTEQSLYDNYTYEVRYHDNKYYKPAVQHAEKKYFEVLHAKGYAKAEVELQKFMHENGDRMKELKKLQKSKNTRESNQATSELSELRRKQWELEDEKLYHNISVNYAKSYLYDDEKTQQELSAIETLRSIQTRKQRIHDIGGIDAVMIDPYDGYTESGLNASEDLEYATSSIKKLKPDWSDKQIFDYIDKTTNVGNKIALPK